MIFEGDRSRKLKSNILKTNEEQSGVGRERKKYRKNTEMSSICFDRMTEIKLWSD